MPNIPYTPTHIVVVASYFYPKIGGLENYAYLLAKHLHQSGQYRVSIITSHYDGDGYKKEIIDDMVVHRLPISFKVSNTPINIAWYWKVKDILAREKPAIIHLHSPVPYLPDIAAAVAGATPLVLTYHSGSMRKGRWIIDMIINVYENIFLTKLFSKSSAVVAISQAFAQRAFPQYADKTYFIPTGVDPKRFQKTPLPESERILFVGRIEHSSSWKGIEPLLQAFVLVLKERPCVILELVGGGDAVEHYRVRAQELGIAACVICAGPKLGQELVHAYQRSSLVVLPSTSDAEAFSIVLVEAMASGRPIIATRIGGNPQVIEEGKNGFLVIPKDPEDLARAIVRVLSDKALAESLGEYGAAKAQKFSWDIQAKKYSDLFQNILKE
jgi:glycosyltransferase involved in cell wall biosynthesis